MRDIQDLRFSVRIEETYMRKGGIDGEMLYERRTSISGLEGAIREWVGTGVEFVLTRANRRNLYYEYVQSSHRVYDLMIEVPTELKARDFAMMLNFSLEEIGFATDVF